jgi:hypothetical protein
MKSDNLKAGLVALIGVVAYGILLFVISEAR